MSLKDLSDCHFYLNSHCTRGDQCQFRHEPSTLRNATECSYFQKGLCNRERCPFRHTKRATATEKNRAAIPCYWETQPQGCLKGPACPFKHEKEEAATETKKIIVNKAKLEAMMKLREANEAAATASEANAKSNSMKARLGVRARFGGPISSRPAILSRLGKVSLDKEDETLDGAAASQSDNEAEELRKDAIKTIDLRSRIQLKGRTYAQTEEDLDNDIRPSKMSSVIKVIRNESPEAQNFDQDDSTIRVIIKRNSDSEISDTAVQNEVSAKKSKKSKKEKKKRKKEKKLKKKQKLVVDEESDSESPLKSSPIQKQQSGRISKKGTKGAIGIGARALRDLLHSNDTNQTAEKRKETKAKKRSVQTDISPSPSPPPKLCRQDSMTKSEKSFDQEEMDRLLQEDSQSSFNSKQEAVDVIKEIDEILKEEER